MLQKIINYTILPFLLQSMIKLKKGKFLVLGEKYRETDEMHCKSRFLRKSLYSAKQFASYVEQLFDKQLRPYLFELPLRVLLFHHRYRVSR